MSDLPWSVPAEDWRMLARNCSMDEDRVLSMLNEILTALPDTMAATRAQALEDGLAKDVIHEVAETLQTHVRERQTSLKQRSNSRPRRTTRHSH